MKKWFVCILLILLPCGCAETPHTEHGQEMALHEMKKGHLFGWVEKQHVRLTDQQINELAQYGIEISKDEKIVVYYSMTARRGRSEVAKAFTVKGDGEHGLFELVVDVAGNPGDHAGLFREHLKAMGRQQLNFLTDAFPRAWGQAQRCAGRRRGLLLPDLPGVDSVEEQVGIARSKAGILPGEPVDLYRFQVERYG